MKLPLISPQSVFMRFDTHFFCRSLLAGECGPHRLQVGSYHCPPLGI